MVIKDKYLKPYNTNDINYLSDVLKNGKLAGNSTTVTSFENNLSKKFSSQYCVCHSSGTIAILSSLISAGVSSNDEVIVPPYATIPTLLPILSLKAIPVFVDTKNGETLDISIDDLELIITKKTKAIIILPLWGYLPNYTELLKYCEKKNIIVIEDACQAHLSVFNNQMVGTLGDYGCFSTHDKKLLATGEGGFVLTQSESNFKKLQNASKLGLMKGESFGLNFKLSTLQAALGISRLMRISDELEIRQNNAKYILEHLKNKNLKELCIPKNSKPNYYNLILVIKNTQDSCYLKETHLKLSQKGLVTDYLKYGGIKYNCSLFNDYKRECPNGELFLKKCISLPTHPHLTKNDLDYLVRLLNCI